MYLQCVANQRSLQWIVRQTSKLCLSHSLISYRPYAVGECFPIYLNVHSEMFMQQIQYVFMYKYVCVTQVTVDMSVPPSPVCHSVEMDVYLGQSELSAPSFLSLSDSSGPVRDSTTSVSAQTHTHTHVHTVVVLHFSFVSELHPKCSRDCV